MERRERAHYTQSEAFPRQDVVSLACLGICRLCLFCALRQQRKPAPLQFPSTHEFYRPALPSSLCMTMTAQSEAPLWRVAAMSRAVVVLRRHHRRVLEGDIREGGWADGEAARGDAPAPAQHPHHRHGHPAQGTASPPDCATDLKETELKPSP